MQMFFLISSVCVYGLTPVWFVFLSEDQREDYLALFDSGSDGRKKLASLSKTSPDRTTWNILVFTYDLTPTLSSYLHLS